jgi:hypothetical protein
VRRRKWIRTLHKLTVIPALERLKRLRPKKAKGYDWLRMHYPGAGDQCAKIRAEFTMHNGIAVVLLASAIFYPVFGGRRWYVFFVLLIGFVIAAIRGRTTRDTFNETVTKFVEAAPKKPPNWGR